MGGNEPVVMARVAGWLGEHRFVGLRFTKTVVAAVAAYSASLPLVSEARPITAALTALLVAQVTLYETMLSGLRRVGAVVSGVLLAVGIAAVLPFTWWSLGIVIVAALVTGRLLRVGEFVIEVAISAMIVYAVSGAASTAVTRVYETLVGAGVAVLLNVIVAPPLYVRPAGEQVRRLADEVAGLLRRIGVDVAVPYSKEQTVDWLRAARDLGRHVARADRAVDAARRSLRANPRGVARPEAAPGLRTGLEALERAAVSLRGMCRTLADRAHGPDSEPIYAGDVRATLGELLGRMADAVTAYGDLVDDEALRDQQVDSAQLRDAIAAAWRLRDHLTGELLADERVRSLAWELHGALLANVDQLLREIDAEARESARQAWREDLAERIQTARTLRTATRPLTRRRNSP